MLWCCYWQTFFLFVISFNSDDWDNSFTPAKWSEMEEAVRSRTEDMSKLQLIGKPLLSDDESDESSNPENDPDKSSNADNETSDYEGSS